jgi:hypothetical protein
LRIDPDERRCAAALLAAKADVADEGVPADASAAEEQGEREVRDPAAAAGQPQAATSLQLGFVDRAGAPVLIVLGVEWGHRRDSSASAVEPILHERERKWIQGS